MTEAERAEERRRGRLAGPAAIVAGTLYLAGLMWGISINSDRPKNDAAELRFEHHHAWQLITASALRAIALLLLIVVVLHLYRATLARKPNLNRLVLISGLVGAVALAVGTISGELFWVKAAADFSSRDVQTTAVAKDLLDGPGKTLPLVASSVGGLMLALWFVIGSLNAMNVGLLTRFLGLIGVVSGPGLLFLPPLPSFWLIGLGLLFLDRWPRGLPPAWEAGEAIPWPSSREDGAAADVEPPEPAPSPNGEVDAVGPGVRKAEPEAGSAAGGEPRRKRKRRR